MIDGQPCRVMDFTHRTPGNLRAFVQVRLRNLVTGNTFDTRLSATDFVDVAPLETKQFQVLYRDQSGVHVMDTHSYDQHTLDDEAVGRLRRGTISGLPAAQLIAQDSDTRMHLTWIAHQHLVFRVAGLAGIRDFESYRETFARAASSFRPLRGDERDRIVETLLRSRPLHAGESLAAFIARTGGAWKVEQTAVANGVTVDAKLEEGFAVKVPLRQRYAGRQREK